ncbi:MAG: hypothetical protein GYB66_08735 [Chloroflexi bacterium]|nr:hypothetical protein [Chloroflexota bacterium]
MRSLPRLTIERLAEWLLFILLFAMAVRVPLDTDTWWHLRSGEYMLEEGEILTEDVFSYTRRGESWVNHSWGSQLVLYGAYRLTGGTEDPAGSGAIGLALFAAVLATAGMLLVYRMCAGNVYSRMFVLVIGAATAAIFWSPRPQMFSFLFSAVVLYILYLYKYRGINRMWAIPALMVLWVNLHAGFAIGFIILIAFGAGEIIGRLLDREAEYQLGWRQLRNVALATIGGILALTVNPYGPRMLLYPFETAGIQTLSLFIQEWQSPNFKMPGTWPFAIMLMALIVLASRTQARPAWSDLALAAGTAMLALWSARNIAVFAVVATPLLSHQLEAWLASRGWQIQPARDLSARMITLNWVLLGVVSLGALAQVATTLSSSSVQEAHEEYLPVEAAEYIERHRPPGPMFNDYNWGGYFIFVLEDYPVFVDGRTDLYGDDFLKDYTRAVVGAQKWQEPLEEYAINLVVVRDESALATLLREKPDQWRIAHEDDLAVVFERQEGP